MRIVIPGITSLIALVFAVALVDQWRVRRHAFQLSWAIGMLFFGTVSYTHLTLPTKRIV